VGRTKVTDDRQTDRRATANSERDPESRSLKMMFYA